jgi:hypothetical protein
MYLYLIHNVLSIDKIFLNNIKIFMTFCITHGLAVASKRGKTTCTLCWTKQNENLYGFGAPIPALGPAGMLTKLS